MTLFSTFQAVIGLVTAIAHVVLWCPQHVKHRRWVGALAGVDLLLSFAAGLVAIIAVTSHPDGHTKTYAGAMTFAFFEWFAVSAAGLVGSFAFDVAAKTQRAAEVLKQSDESEESGKANGLAMTDIQAVGTGGGSASTSSSSLTSNPTAGIAPSEAQPDDAACTHITGHAFDPDNTPEDPELEIELRIGDQVSS